MAVRHHTNVPVLIITRGAENDELAKVVQALSASLAELTSPQGKALSKGSSREGTTTKMSEHEFRKLAPIKEPAPAWTSRLGRMGWITTRGRRPSRRP